MMKRFLWLLLLLPVWTTACLGASSVLIHPGEVIYIRFEQQKLKLKLISATKEKDEQAQVIMSLEQVVSGQDHIILKVVNKFAKDLRYKAEVRAPSKKLSAVTPVMPVVAGKISLEKMVPMVEEIYLFGFGLEK